MDIKKNMKINLNIEKITSQGSGIGRYNGFAVFVNNTVPGDEISAHIIKVSKNYAIAKIDKIINPSINRIDSDCVVSEKCGGCAFRSMSYEDELDYKYTKVKEDISRIGKLQIVPEKIIGADNVNRYRNKAQYPVEINDTNISVGFYAMKSHRIIEIDDCLLQREDFQKGIECFKKWARRNKVTSYNPETKKGLIRHLYFRAAFGTDEIMACLVINGNDIPNREDFIDEMKYAFKNLKSVVLNINKASTNVILGKENITIYGDDYLTDELLNKKFVISPNSFYQVNHSQCEKLYSLAIKEASLTGKETVVDLYCGAGTIGLSMADNAGEVIGIEIVKDAIENAKMNAKINNISNARFICADAFDGAKMLKKEGVKPDVVVLDPPRKGCQKELIETIKEMNPNRIVYVSCDPATLARDLAEFKTQGYTIERVTPLDMFPRTTHVESVVLLTKD